MWMERVGDAAVTAARPGLAQGRKESGVHQFAFEQDKTAGHARALQTEMLTGSGKLARCELDSGLEKRGPGFDLFPRHCGRGRIGFRRIGLGATVGLLLLAEALVLGSSSFLVPRMTARIECITIGDTLPETAEGRAVGKEVEPDDPVAQCHDRPGGLCFMKPSFDLLLCGRALGGPLAGTSIFFGHGLVDVIERCSCRLGTMRLDIFVDFIPDSALIGAGAALFVMHEFSRGLGTPVPRTTVVMSSQALGLGLLARGLFG